VVTGLGIISPLGNSVSEAWDRRSPEPRRHPHHALRPVAPREPDRGEVKGFDVAPYMSPKEARRMDIFIHTAWRPGCRPGAMRRSR
jgi:3-oxoacyl-[acyl-carrier-protein] synthase II